jgi:hypothetical protein
VNPYKQWVTKKIPFIVLSIALITLVPLHLLNRSYQDANLSGKEYLLQKNPRIIFAGDSRAERQLGRLIVFTGPFEPSYLRAIRHSPLYEYEMDFEAKLSAL